jgi:hypothetical protein
MRSDSSLKNTPEFKGEALNHELDWRYLNASVPSFRTLWVKQLFSSFPLGLFFWFPFWLFSWFSFIKKPSACEWALREFIDREKVNTVVTGDHIIRLIRISQTHSNISYCNDILRKASLDQCQQAIQSAIGQTNAKEAELIWDRCAQKNIIFANFVMKLLIQSALSCFNNLVTKVAEIIKNNSSNDQIIERFFVEEKPPIEHKTSEIKQIMSPRTSPSFDWEKLISSATVEKYIIDNLENKCVLTDRFNSLIYEKKLWGVNLFKKVLIAKMGFIDYRHPLAVFLQSLSLQEKIEILTISLRSTKLSHNEFVNSFFDILNLRDLTERIKFMDALISYESKHPNKNLKNIIADLLKNTIKIGIDFSAIPFYQLIEKVYSGKEYFTFDEVKKTDIEVKEELHFPTKIRINALKVLDKTIKKIEGYDLDKFEKQSAAVDSIIFKYIDWLKVEKRSVAYVNELYSGWINFIKHESLNPGTPPKDELQDIIYFFLFLSGEQDQSYRARGKLIEGNIMIKPTDCYVKENISPQMVLKELQKLRALYDLKDNFTFESLKQELEAAERKSNKRPAIDELENAAILRLYGLDL